MIVAISPEPAKTGLIFATRAPAPVGAGEMEVTVGAATYVIAGSAVTLSSPERVDMTGTPRAPFPFPPTTAEAASSVVALI